MEPTAPNIISNNIAPGAQKKSKNTPIIILGIIAVLSAGLATYFGIQYFMNIDVAKTESSTEQSKPEVSGDETKDDATIEENLLTFDVSKMQNAVENVGYTQVTNNCQNDVDEHASALCIYIDEDDPTRVHFSVDRVSAARQYGDEIGVADYTILTFEVEFDQEVKMVYLSGEGQSSTNDTVLYLLEDGTVEYAPVINAFKKASFRSLGKLEGVSDAAKFYTLSSYSTLSGGNVVGNGFRTAYQKTTGEIYLLDLGMMNVDGFPDEKNYRVSE